MTDAGQWLRDDHPRGIRALIDLEGALGYADKDLAEHPDRAESFDALMGRGLDSDAPLIAAAYDCSSLGEVVDVGGGDGSMLIALLRAHPDLQSTTGTTTARAGS